MDIGEQAIREPPISIRGDEVIRRTLEGRTRLVVGRAPGAALLSIGKGSYHGPWNSQCMDGHPTTLSLLKQALDFRGKPRAQHWRRNS